MKVRVDPTRCKRYTICNELAPAVFALDEWGYASVEEEQVPADLEALVRQAAKACPERAIVVEEGDQ